MTRLTCRSSQRHVSPHSLLKECLLLCIWGISDELIDVMVITVYQHTHNCYGHYEKCKHQKSFSIKLWPLWHQMFDCIHIKILWHQNQSRLSPTLGSSLLLNWDGVSRPSWSSQPSQATPGLLVELLAHIEGWHDNDNYWYTISTVLPWAPLTQVDKTP